MTADRAPDPAGLAQMWGAGLIAAGRCLDDVAGLSLRYAEQVQSALTSVAGRDRPYDEVAAELLAAYAAYVRQLAQVPRIGVLRLLHAMAEASATRPH